MHYLLYAVIALALKGLPRAATAWWMFRERPESVDWTWLSFHAKWSKDERSNAPSKEPP
jgi:hypothetical protein